LVLATLAALYYGAARLGLRFASVNPSVTVVWPPTGIALGALLLLGTRIWPALFTGAFFANLHTAGTVASSGAIAFGNTLEGLFSAWLITRFANGRNVLDHARDVFKMAALAGGAGSTVSATIGVTSLAVAGLAAWSDFGATWLTWWLGDCVGVLVVAPLLLAWTPRTRIGWDTRLIVDACLSSVGLAISVAVAFGGNTLGSRSHLPVSFVCTPFLVWIAYRFGQRGAAVSTLFLSGGAVLGTIHGFGPYAEPAPNEALILLQCYIGVGAFTSLILATVATERRHAEAALRDLSVRDPLTGLGNYRLLQAVLQGEIERSNRSGRPFAILFLDVDGLKKINDRFGHLVGSQALCRVASVLSSCSRTVDTAARYGGDEFALVLPEATEGAADQVAQRIGMMLAAETEEPAVRVSIGIALYPRDGGSGEALLVAADQLLYDAKR
jgi:diguanylate cyclase (GGDEF)-like protein